MPSEIDASTPQELAQELGLGDVVWIEVRLRLGLPLHKVVMLAASVWSESPSVGQRRVRFNGATIEPDRDAGLRTRLHIALDAACDRMGI